MRPSLILILLCLLTALAAVGALAVGSNGVDFGGMFSALLGQSDATNREIIFDLRLPRALNAFGCGALLALAGALLQALLRNPLADPFVLGISSGAGALSLIAMLFGAGAALTAAAGFGGALASTGILFVGVARWFVADTTALGGGNFVGSMGCADNAVAGVGA